MSEVATIKLKRIASIVAGQSPPSEEVGAEFEGLPFLQGNAEFGPNHPLAKHYCAVPPKRCNSGDILLSVRAPVGALNIADQVYGIGRGLSAIRPRHQISSRFLWWSLQCSTWQLHRCATGTTYVSVTSEDVGNIVVPRFDFDVQEKIADFLDRETAEIDSLIEKQERLIALLEEKRQAFISHAVTKGLDPTAPMKESGIPLLGEIPAHWSRCKVKHLFSLRNGHSLDSDEIVPEGDFPVYGGNGHRGFTRSYCFEGDHILIGRQGALCGNVHFAFGEFWATEHAIVARPARAMAMKFFGTVLDMMNLGQYSLSAAQPGIAGEFIGNLIVPLPPVDEQMVIAERIETHERDCFAVIRRSRESLRVLTERRAALISAAVTGKIDVTGRV